MGETYLAKKLKPGAKKIELLPNFRLKEWPLRGGEGIVEGNLKSRSERFRYSERKGAVLHGVRGIKKAHPKWANIGSGGFDGWGFRYSQARIGRRDRMFGNHYARFPAFKDSAVAWVRIQGDLAQYQCRFFFMLEGGADIPVGYRLPLCFIQTARYNLERVALFKPSQNAHPNFTFLQRPQFTVLKEEASDTIVPILPDSMMQVDYSVSILDSTHSQATLCVNGLHQITWRQKIKAHGRAYGARFHLGKVSSFTVPKAGVYLLFDEVVLSDSTLGPVIGKPVLSIAGNNLSGSAFRPLGVMPGKHKASQWQISQSNAWLVPDFDSGLDSRWLTERPNRNFLMLKGEINETTFLSKGFRVPIGLSAGKPHLMRVRYGDQSGAWSEWSDPASFVAKALPEGAAGKAPKVRRVYFSEIGKRKPLRVIEKERWYDLVAEAFDPRGWDNLSYIDVHWSGTPASCLKAHTYPGGPFRARDNYSISMSMKAPAMLFAAETEGSDYGSYVEERTSLYCDNAGGQFRWDAERGFVQARVKLLDKAVEGPWALRAFARNGQNRFSPTYASTFLAISDSTAREIGIRDGHPLGRKQIMLLWIGLALVITGFVLARKRFGRTQGLEGEAGQPEAATIPVSGKGDVSQVGKLRQAIEFIEANYGRPISPKDVAEAINVSRNWLGRFFRDGTGLTVGEALHRVRIRNAKKLLCETDLTVLEVSLRVGFASIRNFNGVFKKATGMGPREYRGKNRK